MAEISVSSGSHSLIKDFAIIVLGAMFAALIVYGWDMTIGRLLASSTASYGGVSVTPGA